MIQKLMTVGCQVTFLHTEAVKTTAGRPIWPPLMSRARYTGVRCRRSSGYRLSTSWGKSIIQPECIRERTWHYIARTADLEGEGRNGVVGSKQGAEATVLAVSCIIVPCTENGEHGPRSNPGWARTETRDRSLTPIGYITHSPCANSGTTQILVDLTSTVTRFTGNKQTGGLRIGNLTARMCIRCFKFR